MDLVNHPILLVYTTAPCFLEDKMFQVLNLTGASTWMLLKLYQKCGNLLKSGLVATLLYDGKFRLGLFGKKYSIGHWLKGFNH